MNQVLFDSWLKLQRRSIPNVRAASARLDGGVSGLSTKPTCDPANADAADELGELLKLARRGKRTVVSGAMHGQTNNGLRLAHPLTFSSEVIGAIALEMSHNKLEQQQNILKHLKRANFYLELLLRAQHSDTAIEQELLKILPPVLQATQFHQAVMAAAGVIAHLYKAERVSIGVCRNDEVQPIVLSDSSGFSPRSVLAEQLGKAMNEALVQGGTVSWPGDDPTQTQAHQALAEEQADVGILSLILKDSSGDFGVITLEKVADQPFNQHECDQIERTIKLLCPILALKQAQEAPLLSRARTRIKQGYAVFKTRHPIGMTMGLVAGLVLLGAALLGTSPYRVGGSAELQGEVQRALIVPFDAYVAEAHARAGERVEEGFVLAELDDQALRLELRQLEGELNEHNKQYRKALAGLDHAEAQILKAQISQAKARIDLLQQQLQRTRLLAPFDAIVVTGDLSRSLGKPVERGEVLFELAPLDAYRVAVEVSDRDITLVTAGQPGSLLLAASPTEQLAFEVTNITSNSSSAAPGTFRIEGRLLDLPETLRPGMQGVAKVEVGERRRIWIWTHELVDWLRFQLWKWLP
ncbi:MAG: HlyD family efflux transporter periplasmic adaptor subunit [Gammaproteobacteria bacterium]|nr:HlyD family efflux transporter periplasmic adaptor subunit [Gammaproteobacteria bacterium]